MDYVDVPMDPLKSHKFVTLVADLMFVNGAPFLIAMSRGIKFVTVEYIPTQTSKQLSKYLKRVITIYSRNIMIVKTVLMDMGFNKDIYELTENVAVNTSSNKEHIAEIYRTIHTVK